MIFFVKIFRFESKIFVRHKIVEMSVNTAHTNNGVLIHSGEVILLFSENATIEFAGQNNSIFKGTKQGHIFLTTHRMIFVAKNIQDDIKSFSFPFICLDGVQVDQPLLSGNYVRGKVLAQPNGNFAGQLSFKLWFKSGGALEFGQALLRAISMARSNFPSSLGPPPCLSSSEEPVQAQPSSYTPEPNSYDWLPNFTFRYRPYQSRVFTQNISPPYPGITSNPQPTRATSGPPPPPPQVGFSPPLNPRYPFARSHPQQVPILGAYPPIATCGTPYNSCTPRPTTCGSPPYPPSCEFYS